MINLFSPSANDQSMYYLGQIFGPVGTVLQVNESSLILGTMFRYFNSIVLSVAALVVLYVTIVGVIKTAHEGEFLGKEWNSPWIPIRMVLGIAALVPSASGYCAMQIITMWIIVQGIGAADAIWTTVLNYTNVAGSPTATVSMPSVGVSSNFQKIYAALVCQATAKANYSYSQASNSTKGGYYCYTRSDGFCQMSNDSSGILNIKGPQTTTTTSGGTPVLQYPFGPSGACGNMSFEDAEKICAGVTTSSSTDKQIKCSTATAQQAALQSTVSVLGGIAQQFVTGDYEYRLFFDQGQKAPSWVTDYCSANNWSEEQCCYSSQAKMPGIPTTEETDCKIPPSMSSGDMYNAAPDSVQQIYWPYNIQPSIGSTDFITAAANNYTATIDAATASAVQQASNTSSLSGVLQEAQQRGWIFAGAYYFYLAGQKSKEVSASAPTLAVAPQDPSKSGTMKELRNNYQAATVMLNAAQQSQSQISMSMPSELEDLGDLADDLDGATKDMADAFMSTLTGSTSGKVATNPLADLATLGQYLILIATALFTAGILSTLVLAALSAWGVLFGNGGYPGLGAVGSAMLMLFMPFFTLIVGGLFLFGVVLAVYTPLIPYIVFTAVAIGWFILEEGVISERQYRIIAEQSKREEKDSGAI